MMEMQETSEGREVLLHRKPGQAYVFSQRIVCWLALLHPQLPVFLADRTSESLGDERWVPAWMHAGHEWAGSDVPWVTMWGV
jgi:hypothetical protein